MREILSTDGTPIAYDTVGDGPAVIVIGGAFSQAKDAAEIAAALAEQGLRALTYDRRARGASGFTPPVDPEREVEDLAALIDAAGGSATVFGHSSGAVLALYAAASGLAVERLFLSEPPFRFGSDEVAADLPERIQALVDADEPAEAVVLFQREGVGLPEEMIAQFRQTPLFEALLPLAQSTVFDAMITRQVSTPTPAMTGIGIPVTILCGVETFPLLTEAAERLAAAMPQAEHVTVPESRGHRPDPAATAAIVAARLAG